MEVNMSELKKYDVIQIVPDHKWGGCFLTVTEIFSWGIQGFVQIPEQGQAYIRLRQDEWELSGVAIFVPDDVYMSEDINESDK
jgi:hypothetical protein